MNSIYDCGCDNCKPKKINLANGDENPLFKDVLNAAEKAFKHLHDSGGYKAENITEKPYQNLIDETYKVFNSTVIDNDIPPEMLQGLQSDAFIFGGLKTHAQLMEASSMLLEDGKVKSFQAFERDYQKLNVQYNQNYLEAEYQFAVNSSQMAANWAQLDDSGRYYLQYRTANDDRVRDSHAVLQDITLPQDDAFWLSYYPPNGWRCRCQAVEVRKSKYEVSDSAKALESGEKATVQIGKDGKNRLEMFRFNPGLEAKVFPPKHPYNKVKGADAVKEISSRKHEFESYKNNKDYLNVEFDKKTNGLKATHQLHHFDKKTGKHEKLVQNILFQGGHKIILEDERTGKGKKVDGFLNNQSMDISSISGTGKNSTVRALLHSKSKNADVAILYYPDKETYEKNYLNRSVARFNGQTDYRFKKMIVIVGNEIIEE